MWLVTCIVPTRAAVERKYEFGGLLWLFRDRFLIVEGLEAGRLFTKYLYNGVAGKDKKNR